VGHTLVEIGGGTVISRLFEDLQTAGQPLRKAAVGLISALAYNHPSNQRWLCQENGVTVEGIRVFAIPHSYQNEIFRDCSEHKITKAADDKGCLPIPWSDHQNRYRELQDFLKTLVKGKTDTSTNGIWCYPPLHSNHAGQKFPIDTPAFASTARAADPTKGQDRNRSADQEMPSNSGNVDSDDIQLGTLPDSFTAIVGFPLTPPEIHR
jgi:hypothetical protein